MASQANRAALARAPHPLIASAVSFVDRHTAPSTWVVTAALEITAVLMDPHRFD